MIVTFCGHAQLSQNSGVEKWLYGVTEKLIEEGAASFYLGGYGDFDSLAASVLKNQKKAAPADSADSCSGLSRHQAGCFRL